MDTTEDKELEPLKTAVLSALQTDGSLNEIRAHLRANVFRVCDDFDNKIKNKVKTNKQNPQNLLINQLIREYLKSNGFKHSLNIFDLETGEQNDSDIDRNSIKDKLNLTPEESDEPSDELPLLNTIVKQLSDRKTIV